MFDAYAVRAIDYEVPFYQARRPMPTMIDSMFSTGHLQHVLANSTTLHEALRNVSQDAVRSAVDSM